MMFVIMFWVFRIIVAFTTTMGIDFPFQPINQTIEIILLFVTLVCIILVVKRKLVGAILYLVGYGLYFGTDLYNIFVAVANGVSLEITQYATILVSFIGIILPICVVFELLLDKNRKAHPVDKKTDWLDERADKNNYRTL